MSCHVLLPGSREIAVNISLWSPLGLARCECAGCGVPLVIPSPLFLVDALPVLNQLCFLREPLVLRSSCGKTWCGSRPLCLVKLVSTVMPGLLCLPNISRFRLFCRVMRAEYDLELRFVIARRTAFWLPLSCDTLSSCVSSMCPLKCTKISWSRSPSWWWSFVLRDELASARRSVQPGLVLELSIIKFFKLLFPLVESGLLKRR
jgi:hypothetical protein